MDKKLQIAIIGSRGYPYVYSGYETLVKELSERLTKKGHSVTVYCHSSLFTKKPKIVNGIRLVYTPSIETKTLSQIINSFFSFTHVCFSKSDVILILNSANGPFGILTKIFGKKTCINVDGLEWLRPKWRGLGSLYYKFSSKISTLLFDAVITDSKEMRKVYKTNFKKNSKFIAYGPTMSDAISMEILDLYKLKKNNYYLIVGRLIPDNNSEIIIRGFIKSKSSKKLVIVGDVPYRDKYSDKIKNIKSKKIILTGYIKNQENLSQLYKNCFAYIHGHEFGGTNPTMINALSLNCQILALKTVFNDEMLSGKKAILFEKNLNSISKSVNLFEESFDDLAYSNKNYKLSECYDWDKITDAYLALFLKLKK